MSHAAFNVGIDIGGTNIKFGIVDESGKILCRKKTPTDPQRGSDAVIASIIEDVNALLHEASLRREELYSIGLGVPGTAHAATGTVVYAPNLFWKNVVIAPAIEDAFHTPVSIAQDTRAAAWAEYLVGNARGAHGIAAVTLGTGIGCGMVLDGKIFHGALNTAGEFGHQIVEMDGAACNCGRCGCLEAHAGGLAIVREAKKRIPSIATLLGKSADCIGVDDVFVLAQNGNLQAGALIDSVVRYIGVGLVNLINLTSVEMICLSGGISNAPESLLLFPLVSFVRARAYQAVAYEVKVCRSALGEDAPLIGAALLHRAAAMQSPPIMVGN